MQTFFQDNNSDELILLLNGWGMDERPYRVLESSRDVLFLSDYNDLNFPKEYLNLDFMKYKKKILITFSAGTYMGAYMQEKLPKFDLKISVSGILKLFDKNIGVQNQTLNEMKDINFENALDFRKKLVHTKSEYDKFNKNQPLRTLESSLNELAALRNYYKDKGPIEFQYDKIIIGKNDEILLYENQMKSWENTKNIKTIEGGHFLFYKFTSLDEIIENI